MRYWLPSLSGKVGNPSSPEPKAPRVGIAARLAEIGAYLGAALMVAAGIVVVAQQWADMSYGDPRRGHGRHHAWCWFSRPARSSS